MAAIRDHRIFRTVLLTFIFVHVSYSSALSQGKSSPTIVRMTDQMKFIPNKLTIHVGESVQWMNDGESDGASHSVTTNSDRVMDPKHVSIPEGAKPFDSGIINPGKSFTYTFTVPGVYKYACAPHEGAMQGEIMVEP